MSFDWHQVVINRTQTCKISRSKGLWPDAKIINFDRRVFDPTLKCHQYRSNGVWSDTKISSISIQECLVRRPHFIVHKRSLLTGLLIIQHIIQCGLVFCTFFINIYFWSASMCIINHVSSHMSYVDYMNYRISWYIAFVLRWNSAKCYVTDDAYIQGWIVIVAAGFFHEKDKLRSRWQNLQFMLRYYR